ncbi:hypothetical protein [Psychrobacillus sp. MER TA 171]|uniref:hypothetical protein n=1 Tax=Psychrobacillus sp. MER TA 171 TaxID=2939577 RepID=UPI00203DFF68|nr:hypothetical protein [Psychrobacillus sp. MER TA 171]
MIGVATKSNFKIHEHIQWLLDKETQEKRKRLFLPRQANGEKRGGSSSATGAFIHLTPRGKAVELDIKKSATAYPCPDRQMGKCEEAAPQPPQYFPI